MRERERAKRFLKVRGFTLIELLVVISIIGFLATASMVVFNNVRMKARDTKRLADIKQVKTALELYYDSNGRYPDTDGDGCGGWDIGNKEYQLLSGRLPNIMNKAPNDPTATGNCAGYRYYRYPAGYASCDVSKGAYFVLGVADMETSGNPYPGSPGWSCPSRNWQGEFDWVTGGFEN